MAVWVVANMHFSRVLRRIGPLEAQLDELKGQLADSQQRLQQCQQELSGLDEQVGGGPGVGRAGCDHRHPDRRV